MFIRKEFFVCAMEELVEERVSLKNTLLPRERTFADNSAHRKVGMWLSLVERCVRDVEVAGSNPVIPTRL
jgi:hypothetical protein